LLIYDFTEADILQDTSGRPPNSGGQFLLSGFFDDAPWLNIPKDRCGKILIEPVFPAGKLLGGSASQGKISKLAALAAARKKKANETTKATPTSSTASVALLDKLSGRARGTVVNEQDVQASESLPSQTTGDARSPKAYAGFHAPKKQKMHDSDSPPEAQRRIKDPSLPTAQNLSQPAPTVAPVAPLAPVAPTAAPSGFAKILFGDRAFWQEPPAVASFQPYYTLPQATHFTDLKAFAGPSPDDIVLKAQSSKGVCLLQSPG
jgi:elongation factor 1 alpha-like protein